MPPTLTYPGVYIEELPSGVHTITGVATSIAAFAGWAPRGSATEAVLVESWSDFARQFGGLSSGNYLGYAVNQFFANGGQRAYIIRLVATVTDTPTAAVFAATASGIVSTLTLFASSPGQWGNNLKITVTPSTLDPTRFSVLVQLVSGGQTVTLENFSNLSVTPTDPQYVVNVIDNDSSYITFIDPTISPPPTPAAPALPGATASGNMGTSTVGTDGDVLVPATNGNFELALLSATGKVGINLLDRVDIFNLLCVPAETDPATVKSLQTYCVGKRAFYIIDPPHLATIAGLRASGPAGTGGVSVVGPGAANAAYYFPWVSAPDPLAGNRPVLFPPCGFVAGVYASTDASRGVWKAPAGVDAGLTSEIGLQYVLTDLENGDLNIQAINCLREFKVYGDVVWGARTLAGNDQAGSQWKYVPIRRLALFLESSLYDGTQWVVFEPNDERLWSQIRLNVGAFMQGLFLQGAFQGTTPQQAYFVKCDAENNPQSSIDMGIVNILVGFAPLYPAEFVVIQIQQMAGQLKA
ncbi:MAG TPA: phage tail sheath C-terminal domain-containing protein [Candidatus Acidoferrum sp.]|jgi:phage tail sheath protein FI|nr:phage tail sheath C-terminal domain-containing protein [Candidatus Acidoferrum sp.]